VTADTDADRFARTDACPADEVDTNLSDRELVNEAWKQLHPSHREVIRKAYYLGWTTGQIAADLNVTEPCVKSQLHYALHTLRLALSDPTLRSRISGGTHSRPARNCGAGPVTRTVGLRGPGLHHAEG
jgi:DNA-directed RNA polymerase specialized sigma24 family protein